jgi:hypothetical protein
LFEEAVDLAGSGLSLQPNYSQRNVERLGHVDGKSDCRPNACEERFRRELWKNEIEGLYCAIGLGHRGYRKARWREVLERDGASDVRRGTG